MIAEQMGTTQMQAISYMFAGIAALAGLYASIHFCSGRRWPDRWIVVPLACALLIVGGIMAIMAWDAGMIRFGAMP